MWPFKRKSSLEKALRKTRAAVKIVYQQKISHTHTVEDLEQLHLLARMLEDTHHTATYIVASLRHRKS